MDKLSAIRFKIVLLFLISSVVIFLTSIIVLNNIYLREYDLAVQSSIRQETQLAISRIRRFLTSQTDAILELQQIDTIQNTSASSTSKTELLKLAQKTSPEILYIILTDTTGKVIASSNEKVNQFLNPSYFQTSKWAKQLFAPQAEDIVYVLDPKPGFKLSPAIFPKETFWTFSISTKIFSDSGELIGLLHILYDWESLLESRLLATSKYVFLFDENTGLIGSTYDLAKLFYSPDTAPSDYKPPQSLAQIQDTQIILSREQFLGSKEKYYLATGKVEKHQSFEPSWYIISTESPETSIYLHNRLLIITGAGILFLFIASLGIGYIVSTSILSTTSSLSNLSTNRATRLRTIINNLEGLIIIITDNQGIITDLNTYAEKFFHQSKDQLLDLSLSQLVRKLDQLTITNLLGSISTSKPAHTELTLQTELTGKLHTSVTAFTIPSEFDGPEYVWLFQDSTLKHQYDDLLVKFERQFF